MRVRNWIWVLSASLGLGACVTSGPQPELESTIAPPVVADKARQAPPRLLSGKRHVDTAAAPKATMSRTAPATKARRRVRPKPHAGWLGAADLALVNDENLLYVYPGMSRQSVQRRMDRYRAQGWKNPCGYEMRIGQGGQLYEAVFYLTREPRRARPVSERWFTPVIFKRGEVEAIGRYRLKKLRSSSDLVVRRLNGCPKLASIKR